MHRRDAVPNELLGDKSQTVALPLHALFRSKRRMLADPVENVPGAIRNAAIQLPTGIAVERPAWWIRRLFIDVRHFERFAVVKRSVPAAVMHHHRMLLGNL